MSDFIFNLGRQLGHGAIPVIRKSKWIWHGLTGSAEEVLQAELEMGSAMAADLRATIPLENDPRIVQLVGGICGHLAARVREKRRVFHCDVLLEDVPNAMALPGGFIFVSRLLVDLCDGSLEELAFVIGHEMAHIILRHAWNRMLNQAALGAASTVAARAGAVGGWLRSQGLAVLQNAHSRDNELKADELGYRLVVASGFDPAGALTLLQRIGRLRPEQTRLSQYLASHPSPAERIAHLPTR